jgi:surface polysaccharide O-acyltransferase-like enzyme
MFMTLGTELGVEGVAFVLPFVLMFTAFPLMAISISSYLLGRAIFTSDKATVNKKLLASFLLLVYSIFAILYYEIAVNNGDMANRQYIVSSLLIFSAFVVLPMWLARPNKLLLMLTAQFHKGF